MTGAIHLQKQQLRAAALLLRDSQLNADALSQRIFERLISLPEYLVAQWVMLYMEIRGEVRTQWFLETLWNDRKRVAVPYCSGDRLELFALEGPDELSPGAMGIPEPRRELRSLLSRKVDPAQLDLIVVPGVAFDHRGNRLGHGKGYYDRFLRSIRPDAVKLTVCYECQLFDEIPSSSHDIPMDLILTEKAVYRTRVG